MKSSKTTFLTVRLAPSEHTAFSRKARSFGGTSFVLREIVSAFIDGRMIIQPNPERQTLYTDIKQVTQTQSFLNNSK